MAAVDTVPLAPLPGDPNFDALMQDFAFAMRPLSIQLNAAIQALNNNSTNAVSSSSMTVSTGLKSFIASTAKSYVPGQPVRIASTANGAIWMEGDVTAYDADTGAMSVTVSRKQGSETIGSWSISLSPASLNLDRKGTAVVSAASPNIWAGDGNTIHLTGTTTVTSFAAAPSAGMRQKVVLDGAINLINSANLILPGATDYQGAEGDILDVYADTTTKFYVSITKANGRPVLAQQGSAPWRFLSVDLSSAGLATSVNAADLVMTDSAGNQIIVPEFYTGVVNANLAGSVGAGGIDASATLAAGQTWYLYVILSPDLSTKGLIFSQDVDGPVLPSGYAYYAYVASTVVTNATGPVVLGFSKGNNIVRLTSPLTIVDGTITASAWTSLVLAGLIPLTGAATTRSRGANKLRMAFGGTGVHLGLRESGTVSGSTANMANEVFSGAIGGTSQTYGMFPTARPRWITGDIAVLPYNANGGIQYYSDTTTGTICILGWEE